MQTLLKPLRAMSAGASVTGLLYQATQQPQAQKNAFDNSYMRTAKCYKIERERNYHVLAHYILTGAFMGLVAQSPVGRITKSFFLSPATASLILMTFDQIHFPRDRVATYHY